MATSDMQECDVRCHARGNGRTFSRSLSWSSSLSSLRICLLMQRTMYLSHAHSIHFKEYELLIAERREITFSNFVNYEAPFCDDAFFLTLTHVMFPCPQKEGFEMTTCFPFLYTSCMIERSIRSNNSAGIRTDRDNSKSIIAHCPFLLYPSFSGRNERTRYSNFRVARTQIPGEQESAKQTRRVLLATHGLS
jgi:hypothetical protein